MSYESACKNSCLKTWQINESAAPSPSKFKNKSVGIATAKIELQ